MSRYGTFTYGDGTLYGGQQEVEAGVTHHILLDGIGFMLQGLMTRTDITSAIPRVSVATDQRQHTDFSERDTFGQSTWHHGRGALDYDDPATFFDSNGVMTWIPSQVTLVPANTTASHDQSSPTDFDGYISAMEQYSGNLYALKYGNAAANNALYLWDNANSTWDLVTPTGTALNTTSGEPTHMVHYADQAATSSVGYLYIAQGETVNMLKVNNSGAGSSAVVPARAVAVFDSYLWRADNLNELYYSADPSHATTPTWSGPVYIGGSEYPIRNMLAGWDGGLWVFKDDGVYVVRNEVLADGSIEYVPYQMIDLSHQVSSNNGRAAIQFGNNLYFSTEASIIRYDGSTIAYMGPQRGRTEVDNGDEATFLTSQFGKVTGLAHDDNVMYASVASSSGQSARIMVYNGTGWHTLYTHTTADVDYQSVFHTSVLATSGVLDYPVVWFSDNSGTAGQWNYIKLPRRGANPVDDTDLVYPSSGTLTTAWFDANLSDIIKTFFNVLVTGTGLSPSGNTVTVEFQVDDYDVWYTLGDIVRDRLDKVTFPDNGTLDPSLAAHKIRYRFTLTRDSGTTTTTPVMRSWAHRFITRPEARYGWSVVVRCYNNVQLLDRTEDEHDARFLRNSLYNMRDKDTPLHFDDGKQIDAIENLIQNPSFEIDSDSDGTADGVSVVGTGVTLSRNGQYKVAGILSQKVAVGSGVGDKGITLGTFSVTAGDNVSASAYVYVESGDRVHLEILDGSSTVVGEALFRSPQSHFDTRFQRQSVFFTAATSGSYTMRTIRRTAEGSNATVWYVDAAEFVTAPTLELTSANPLYVDGDQLRCSWTGTPHASTSRRSHGYYVYISGLSEVERYSEAMSDDGLSYNSEITLQLREML